MLSHFLPFFALIGIASIPARLRKRPLAPYLLTSAALMGLLEFLCAMMGCLRQGALFILIFGNVMFCHAVLKDRDNRSTIYLYLGFAIFIMLFSFGLRFGSIDDYSFWGLISKYLFITHQLPTTKDFISEGYLSYTPGMACFHYLFYFTAKHYSQFSGYVAQGALLSSALMVLWEPETPRISILKIIIAYLILSVGFGTVFARMEVDAYVAAFVFSISWLIYKKPKDLHDFIMFPILFLPFIKEIGLLFAFILTLTWLITNFNKQSILPVSITIAGLIGLKWTWMLHCKNLGFHSFSAAIHGSNALNALNPWNSYFQPARQLMLKALFFNPFGHVLAWPNLITYLLLFILWKKSDLGQRAYHIKWMYLLCLILYGLMIYLLQAIVFNVGHSFHHLLDFQRYYNMWLIPFCLFSVLILFEKKARTAALSWKQPLPLALVTIGLIFVLSGKIERTTRYYLPNVIYPLVEMVQKNLPSNQPWTLCLDNPPEPTYNITLPLTYFFLPNRVRLLNEATHCQLVMRWGNDSHLPNIERA